MKGRKPTPPQVHKLRGTFKKCRHSDTLDLPTSTPEPPEHLDDIALDEWNRLVGELAQVGTLHKLDRTLLATYCVLWSHLTQAERGIREHGLVIKGATGAAQASPYYSVAMRAASQLTRIAAELGLSPSSRARLKVQPPADQDDEFERMLNGMTA